jgi:hypothetical protein
MSGTMRGAGAGAAAAIWRRDAALPFQRMSDETVVVDPRTREVHLLNETGARIWDLLDTPRSLDDLVRALGEEYDGDPEALRREVTEFVAAMGGKGLVTAA